MSIRLFPCLPFRLADPIIDDPCEGESLVMNVDGGGGGQHGDGPTAVHMNAANTTSDSTALVPVATALSLVSAGASSIRAGHRQRGKANLEIDGQKQLTEGEILAMTLEAGRAKGR